MFSGIELERRITNSNDTVQCQLKLKNSFMHMAGGYYNTDNYATIEDRARMIIRLNMKCWAPNIYIWYFCQVRTENVWWRSQGILGVGNRHDNIDSGIQGLYTIVYDNLSSSDCSYTINICFTKFFRQIIFIHQE